jgi:hypothetical protein
MVFDYFKLGSVLNSNNNDNSDSYLDSTNNKLYVIPTYKSNNSNLIIYNIASSDLANNNFNITITCNIPLYTSSNIKEYFFIKDKEFNAEYSSNNIIELYTKDLANNLKINKINHSYSIVNRNVTINLNNQIDNYIDGFYYNTNTYLIHEYGRYIRNISILDKYDITKNNINNFLLQANNKDNNVLHLKVDNYIYIIVSDQNFILRWDINNPNNNPIIILIKNYNIVIKKFSKAIYSYITQKIYLIPYNITELIIIDVKTNNLEFIKIQGLTELRQRSFFSTAIEYQGYIYMIPESYNYIYIFDIYNNKILNIIDISSFTNESKKFINAHLFKDNIRKRIFAIPNKFNNLGIIDYDQGSGAILDTYINFNIIYSTLFKNSGNDVYTLINPVELGDNTFYNTIYTRGNTLFSLNSETNKDLFEWKPKNAISVLNYNFESYIKSDNSYFEDNNSKIIFNIYKPTDTLLYRIFTLSDFISENKIKELSVNNIYSIENNTVYIIPYNFKYLLALDLNNKTPLLKIIDITKNITTNSDTFKNFMNLDITGRFNCSIIFNNKLYIVPYINSYSNFLSILIYPFIIYDIINNNIIVKNLKPLISSSEAKLFCAILFYNTEYLFLIAKNASASLAYNINTTEFKTISGLPSGEKYSDGYINNNIIYLLNTDHTHIIIYSINVTTITFSYNTQIPLNPPTPSITDRYSNMLFHNNKLYFIPYNDNKIGILDIGITPNIFTESTIIPGYLIENKLFNGGTIIKLNNKTYIIMVPYNANKLYMYNINTGIFTFIDDDIFKTNKFVNCTVDIKGNIYMNTSEGDILYYVLSIEKNYLKPRLPVFSNKTISFKDIYSKFHTDYIYTGYNFNNKQIKISDYLNQGGAKYYTVSAIKDNKFIIDETNIIIPKANSKTLVNSTYLDFLALQCNIIVNLNNYKKIKSQRYEYYDVAGEDYTIDSINVATNNTYVHYVKKFNNRIELHSLNTLIDSTITTNIITHSINTLVNLQESLSFEINLETKNISDAMFQSTGISTKTLLYIYILVNKRAAYPNDILVFNSQYFITNGISTNKPSENMINLNTVDFDIIGSIMSGINIIIDKLNNIYLNNLSIINIKIKSTGSINYGNDINRKKLIILSNTFKFPNDLNINIYEDVTYLSELYYNDEVAFNNSINTFISFKNITKLTICITSNRNITININTYSNLIYLKDIIILINTAIFTSIITLNSSEIRHKLNIIIYDNTN